MIFFANPSSGLCTSRREQPIIGSRRGDLGYCMALMYEVVHLGGQDRRGRAAGRRIRRRAGVRRAARRRERSVVLHRAAGLTTVQRSSGGSTDRLEGSEAEE